MCMIDDGESPSFYTRDCRKARKRHQCYECGRTIEPGETYEVTSGMWDGSVNRFKTCRHCEAGVTLLRKHCGGAVHGGVLEDLRDHIHSALPWASQAARVVVGMRRKWKRFDGQGLMKPIGNLTRSATSPEPPK